HLPRPVRAAGAGTDKGAGALETGSRGGVARRRRPSCNRPPHARHADATRLSYAATMKKLRCLFLASSATLTAPALADPFTYKGTLGNIDIVVEISSDPSRPSNPVVGRYFYMKQGVDIPL